MTEAEKWRDARRRIIKSINDGLKAQGIGMTEAEAKKIIIDDPEGNIVKRMEAIAVARYFLGDDCTMEEIWKWAEGGDKNVEALI